MTPSKSRLDEQSIELRSWDATATIHLYILLEETTTNDTNLHTQSGKHAHKHLNSMCVWLYDECNRNETGEKNCPNK